MQRQPMGGNAMRSCALLPAVTGNLGRPGTGFLYLNGATRRGIDGGYVTGEHLAAQERPVVSQMDLAERLEDPQRAGALLAWNINIAASNPQQTRLRAALAREDLFTVAIDIFPTDTTDLADVVLPAASFLECDDLVLSYFDLSVSAQAKAGDPPGDALPNPEIFRRLAAAMGYTEPELFEPDDEVIEELVRQTGIGLDFAGLREVGTVPYGGEPIVQFPGGVVPTPSGRVEIASARAEADGLPRLPFPHADPRPGDDMLRLLSPASPWLLNDSFANDPKVTRADRLGEGRPASARRRRPRARRRRPGRPLQRDRPARAGARAVRGAAARRRAVTQGPLAQARGDQRQRERAQPGHEVRHGGGHVGARRRGAGEPGLAVTRRRRARQRPAGRACTRPRCASCARA